jgi:1,2-phenylacetyl-CoA epoxidase PaaB subunit
MGLLWTSDQPIAKGSTYTGQHNTETYTRRNTKTNIHTSSEIRTHDPSNQTAKTYALDHAATGTGHHAIYHCTYNLPI